VTAGGTAGTASHRGEESSRIRCSHAPYYLRDFSGILGAGGELTMPDSGGDDGSGGAVMGKMMWWMSDGRWRG
jgi:hypothetical protein